ncbi:MAG: hypothetical protein WCB85_13210 [Candidatus Dormiibacterota bacterium]
MGATVFAQPYEISPDRPGGTAEGPFSGAIPRDPRVRWIIAATALFSVAIRALEISRPAGLLSGGSYDTSVWLGSAIRLVHGIWPYRDFVLVQPPGLPLALTPLALFSYAAGARGALILLTACTPLLAAANVVLVGRLVRHRGWPAVLVACGFMAVYPATYVALGDGQLEPLMDLFVLIGLTLAFRGDLLAGGRRLAAGGAVLGFAASVLVAAFVPALVIAAICARQPKRLLLFAGSLVIGFAAPNLPFLVIAPSSTVNESLLTLLHRVPGGQRTPLPVRLFDMTFSRAPVEVGAAVAVLVILAIVTFRPALRRPSPLGWFAIGSTVAMTAAQFAVAVYYPHYPAMLAPFLAVLLGVAAGRRRSFRWGGRLVPSVAVVALGVVLVSQVVAIEGVSGRDPAPIVDSMVPQGACALAAHTQFLVMSDRFISSVPGCSALVDPFGTELAYGSDRSETVAVFGAALASAGYLVLDTSPARWLGGAWAAPLRAYIAGHFREVRPGLPAIWRRDPQPGGHRHAATRQGGGQHFDARWTEQ